MLSTYDVFLQLPDLHNYIVNQMQTAHANKQRYQEPSVNMISSMLASYIFTVR